MPSQPDQAAEPKSQNLVLRQLYIVQSVDSCLTARFHFPSREARAVDRYLKLKSDLRKSGLSLRGIARDLGVAHTSVVDVARGVRRSGRIEAAIARELQTTPSELWPDRDERREQ